MRPDSIFTCIKSYNGKNQNGKPIRFEEGKEYMRTTVDMKKMGHGSKGITYFIHDWNNPSKSSIELSQGELDRLVGQYLGESRPMA